MKILLVIFATIALSACASQTTVDSQMSELKALGHYHEAQREQEKATQAVVVSTDALAASTLKRVEADKAVKEAKAELEKQLKTTGKE